MHLRSQNRCPHTCTWEIKACAAPVTKSKKMNDIQLIPCTLHHLHTLQDIAINAYGDHYLYLWFDGGVWYINRCFSEAALQRELANPNAAFFLIYNGDELAGFLKLNLHQPLEGYTAEEALELERIYLTRAASGKGIGRQVLRFTKDIAKRHHKHIIWLKTMDSSRAISFYEQNGFRKCGRYNLDFEQMKPRYRGMYILKSEL